MKVGIVGMGKLGFPVAIAMTLKGHEVYGYDTNGSRMLHEVGPWNEAGPDGVEPIDRVVEETRGKINFVDLPQLCQEAEIIFVAVQTPSDIQWDGAKPIRPTPGGDLGADFSYENLEAAVRSVAYYAPEGATVVVISTVMPGTMRERISHLCEEKSLQLLYNPYFIAMGTVIRDFLNPEFKIIGCSEGIVKTDAFAKLEEFYGTIGDFPIHGGSWETIETAKMCYNTFIGLKIIFANTIMEMCDAIEFADCDEVSHILSDATERLISPKYMLGGMGDGGACHPRDQAALSYLAGALGIPNIFWQVMSIREEQAHAMCLRVEAVANEKMLPIAILGTAFKAGTNIEFGSSSLLCAELMENWANSKGPKLWDPKMGRDDPGVFDEPHVYLVGCNHREVLEKCMELPEGSVVVDPWRQVPHNIYGVEVLRVGERDRYAGTTGL